MLTNKQLEDACPFIFLDAIRYIVKEDGHYLSKVFYTVLGLRIDGRKEVLGFYLGESENIKFWLQVLANLYNRRVQAINSVFPNIKVELCIVHQIRNFLRYVGA